MLLKVVSHCDLSMLSTSVMGFKKSFDKWVSLGVSSIHFFGNFLTLQSPWDSSKHIFDIIVTF